jgi:hypothetical protein
MGDTVWSNPGNPPRWIARRFGLTEHQFSRRLHKLKLDAGLGGADRVSINSDGTVLDANGEEIGNLYDEY